MWILGCCLSGLVLGLVCVVAKDLATARRFRESGLARRSELLVLSLLILLADLVLLVLLTLGDARIGPWQSELPIGTLVFGAATLGLAAFAMALLGLATPRAVRSAAMQGTVAACLLIGFGIGGCYGLMFLGNA